MIKVSIPNYGKFKKALSEYPILSAVEFKKAFEKSLNEIVRQTVPLTPVDTGRLVGSIGSQKSEGIYSITKTSASVGTNVKYAMQVHEGFARHRLGQRKYLEVGANKSLPKIKEFFKEAFENIFETMARDSR